MAETTTNSGLLAVRLVTPDRVLLDATAESVELPAMVGYMEALYGAAPLLAELGAGEVRLHGGTSGDQKFFVYALLRGQRSVRWQSYNAARHGTGSGHITGK